MFLLSVRGITCISYNIYHSKKLKLCLFNNDFKVRLPKVTYLGYIWNYLRQGQILVRQKYNLFNLKSSFFSDFQWPRVQISRRCVHKFIAQSVSCVKGLSDRITHMAVKIAVTPEFEDEKRQFH